MQTLMQPFFGAGLQLYAACNAALDAALFRAGFLLCAAFDAALFEIGPFLNAAFLSANILSLLLK